MLLIYYNSIAAMSNEQIENDIANALLNMGEAIAALLLFVTGIVMCGVAIVFLICGITGFIAVKHRSVKGAFINAIFKAVLSCIGVVNNISTIISGVAKNTMYLNAKWQIIISMFMLGAILILSIKEIVNYVKVKR
jgi:hypothetical protein